MTRGSSLRTRNLYRFDAVQNSSAVKRSADQVVRHGCLTERAEVRIGETVGMTGDRRPVISGGKVALG